MMIAALTDAMNAHKRVVKRLAMSIRLVMAGKITPTIHTHDHALKRPIPAMRLIIPMNLQCHQGRHPGRRGRAMLRIAPPCHEINSGSVNYRETNRKVNDILEKSDMKQKLVWILAGLVCLLVLAAGCTSTTNTQPAVTTTATTAAVTTGPTTAAPALSVTGTVNSTSANDTINGTPQGTPAISRISAIRPPLTRSPGSR